MNMKTIVLFSLLFFLLLPNPILAEVSYIDVSFNKGTYLQADGIAIATIRTYDTLNNPTNSSSVRYVETGITAGSTYESDLYNIGESGELEIQIDISEKDPGVYMYSFEDVESGETDSEYVEITLETESQQPEPEAKPIIDMFMDLLRALLYRIFNIE
jgi:hypothetical protein